MKNRRKGRPPTRGGWTPESSRKAHAAKARKRMESPPDNEPRRVPEGELLGVLRWYAADGTVRQWIITQGNRANNIAVLSLGKRIVCGWDRLFRSLRKRLAVTTVVSESKWDERECWDFCPMLSQHSELAIYAAL